MTRQTSGEAAWYVVWRHSPGEKDVGECGPSDSLTTLTLLLPDETQFYGVTKPCGQSQRSRDFAPQQVAA
ncbi:hypothetical protein RRG08_063445 [Elysia crispata]|uniref:Uncharacterized protein n=1 Tax=Elysia crispata TaxID=231223 RepID=A0AAE1A9G9_9GAST|nr:hypothetical protein RRG08_063445 [Elysia crispata]